uniref:Uncharacterized protein n=1 Tax=Lepeophtheirus salmonis TaxID=72036 RepID=A0A0K2UP08_LEPSM
MIEEITSSPCTQINLFLVGFSIGLLKSSKRFSLNVFCDLYLPINTLHEKKLKVCLKVKRRLKKSSLPVLCLVKSVVCFSVPKRK